MSVLSSAATSAYIMTFHHIQVLFALTSLALGGIAVAVSIAAVDGQRITKMTKDANTPNMADANNSTPGDSAGERSDSAASSRSTDDSSASQSSQPELPENDDILETLTLCNETFRVALSDLEAFNTTGALPDEKDKTGMCFLRCFFEKMGFIDQWQLNGDAIRSHMWTATGDTIEHCQEESKNEVNQCVRLYGIAKCLMLRSIVDARNKPVV